ncbi:response regulator [Candidatus Sumerlaeota bacterium]|nr:response regulator [Candidatus Sumerlaeota bacterium]
MSEEAAGTEQQLLQEIEELRGRIAALERGEDHERFEGAARQSEEVYRRAIENARGVPYRLIFSDTKYDFVGEGIEDLIGVSAEAFTFAALRDMVQETVIFEPTHCSDPHRVTEEFRAGEFERFRADYRVRLRSGEERWLSDCSVAIHDEQTGQVIGSLGILIDITERKRAEEAQRAQLIRVQRQQAAIVYLATHDILSTGNFAAAAQVATETVAEAIETERVGVWLLSDDGQTLRCVDLFERGQRKHSEGLELMASQHPRYFESLKSGRAIDASNACEDPRTSEFCEGYLRPLGIASMLDAAIRISGEVVGVVCHEHMGEPRTWHSDEISFAGEVADQLAQALLRLERQRLEAQVQHAQKLESLGVLAGGIAHDFNNLLVGILGNASLALFELPPASPARDFIKQIDVAAQHAADLTRQMLAYSGRGKFVVQALNLSMVVEEMVHMLKVSISKKVGLRLQLDHDLPSIEADASQITQVIMNLVTNASEAIGDECGVITIITGVTECDLDDLADTYLNEGLSAGTFVTLEVADTGCGMSQETLDKIFDPFFTTKFTGRGLGLAAVMGIVRGHGGAMRVRSELGQGTVFTVLLPASSKEAEDTVTRTPQPLVWRSSGKVLVADDEMTVRELARRVLEQVGFEVLLATDGREAVELFRAHADEIRVVLLDMTMPHLDGEETFDKMWDLHPDVRVILSSGYSEQEATERFHGRGLAGFLQKPYRPLGLIETIRGVLEQREP